MGCLILGRSRIPSSPNKRSESGSGLDRWRKGEIEQRAKPGIGT
jgi:hypothetical protein